MGEWERSGGAVHFSRNETRCHHRCRSTLPPGRVNVSSVYALLLDGGELRVIHNTSGDGMAVLNIRVDDQVRDELKDIAEAEGVTISEYVRDLVRRRSSLGTNPRKTTATSGRCRTA